MRIVLYGITRTRLHGSFALLSRSDTIDRK